MLVSRPCSASYNCFGVALIRVLANAANAARIAYARKSSPRLSAARWRP